MTVVWFLSFSLFPLVNCFFPAHPPQLPLLFVITHVALIFSQLSSLLPSRFCLFSLSSIAFLWGARKVSPWNVAEKDSSASELTRARNYYLGVTLLLCPLGTRLKLSSSISPSAEWILRLKCAAPFILMLLFSFVLELDRILSLRSLPSYHPFISAWFLPVSEFVVEA